MGAYRNVTTLHNIEITDRKEKTDCIIFEAKWAEPRSEIDACRRCGSVEGKLTRNGWGMEKINDTPWGGKPVGIRLKKQEYQCGECGGTFTSEHPAVCDDRHMTRRLARKIKEDGLKSPRIEALADRFGVSVGSIWNLLRGRIEKLSNQGPLSPMRILGIDELHMSEDGPYTVLTDLWHGTVIELMESNDKPDIRETLREIVPDPQIKPNVHVPKQYGTWRDWGVVAVVMDMDTRYREVAQDVIPRAKVIVDRFHIVDKASKSVTKVRRRATSAKDKERREERKAKGKVEDDESYVTKWKRKKDIFGRRWESLSPAEQFRLEEDLRQIPDLKDAYFAYDEFKQIFDLNDPDEARKAFRAWERRLPESIEEEFEKVTRPLSNWREEILNYFRFSYKYANGGTEGLNRAIRQINREGVGHTSFDVLKAKVLARLGPQIKTGRERRGGTSIFRGKAASE
jgi:transposase